MTPVIEIDHLSRRFGEIIAVDELSLEVKKGEIFGFLGHNGAGKTTTIRLLNGILLPSSGKAKVLGYDPQIDGLAVRARTGVLTETPSLDERLNARENLSIYADLYGVQKNRVGSRVAELLAAFELDHRAEERTSQFSKGMKQRLALARALIHNPEILFLDEPTSGLDPVAARHVHELVENLVRNQERTVFLCTHNLVEAQRLCDRVAVMEKGRMVALGTPGELATRYGKHLTIELEVDPEQVEIACETVRIKLGWEIKIINNHGHLQVSGGGREAIPKLLNHMVKAGVQIYHAASQQPSLEDVYFAIHGDKETMQ